MKNHLLLISLLLLPFNIFAQPTNNYSTIPDSLTLDMIVVTGTRSDKYLKDTPIQTQIISSKEIRSGGMSRLEDVLSSNLSGMEFHQAGYGVSMSFQGLDARHVLILVDGERLSGDINGNVDFSKIPIESIQRVEVVKGSSSVLYGSNAMGATINIITKRANYGFNGSTYYNFGGYNQINSKDKSSGDNSDILNMTASTHLGYSNDKFSTTTDITYQGVDPYRLISKQSEKRHYKIIDNKPVNKIIYAPIDSSGISVSGWKSLAINQKIDYKISDKISTKVNSSYFLKNRYDLGDYSSNIENNSDIEIMPIENIQGYNITANILYEINEKHLIEFSFHTSETSRKQDSLNIIEPKQRNSVTVERVLYRNNAINNNSLTVGLDLNRETLNLDLSSGGFNDKYSYNTLSIYAQNDLKLTDKIDILTGLRFDNYGFTSFNNLFKNSKDITTTTTHSKGKSITPQLALKYNINNISLRANYAMGFRTPSLKERYMEYYQPYMGMTIVGNPNLTPETNNYFSISADYLLDNKKLYLVSNVYANIFKNKIDAYHNIETNELIYQNTQNSELYGIDISARLILLEGFNINSSYSFNYKKESEPVNSAQYIFTSPHTVSLQSSYTFSKDNWLMTPSLSVNYYSSKSYEDMMPTIIHNSGSFVPEVIEGIYDGHLEGYALCNLTFNTTLNNKYIFTVGVNNLLNYTPNIASFNSALTPGMTGYLSVRATF